MGVKVTHAFISFREDCFTYSENGCKKRREKSGLTSRSAHYQIGFVTQAYWNI